MLWRWRGEKALRLRALGGKMERNGPKSVMVLTARLLFTISAFFRTVFWLPPPFKSHAPNDATTSLQP